MCMATFEVRVTTSGVGGADAGESAKMCGPVMPLRCLESCR